MGVSSGFSFQRRRLQKCEGQCVIGSKVYDELFLGEDAIGKVILADRLPITVVGVLKEKGGGTGGPQIDDRVIMPLPQSWAESSMTGSI